jgi:hypothetical protein
MGADCSLKGGGDNGPNPRRGWSLHHLGGLEGVCKPGGLLGRTRRPGRINESTLPIDLTKR